MRDDAVRRADELGGRLIGVERERDDVIRRADELGGRLVGVERERDDVIRRADELGAELAAALDRLEVARLALTEAEAELLALRGMGSAPAVPPRRPATRRTPASKRVLRRLPDLPPGLFDGMPEANRHLVASRANVLVVDGYNLARAAWSGLDPVEERRRVVAMLEEVRARSKGTVVVVFDGESGTVAPSHSRSVRVRFSASGVTADAEIVDVLAGLPVDRPVVIVSSDRAVMGDARRHGAVAIGALDFLAAAGR